MINTEGVSEGTDALDWTGGGGMGMVCRQALLLVFSLVSFLSSLHSALNPTILILHQSFIHSFSLTMRPCKCWAQPMCFHFALGKEWKKSQKTGRQLAIFKSTQMRGFLKSFLMQGLSASASFPLFPFSLPLALSLRSGERKQHIILA